MTTWAGVPVLVQRDGTVFVDDSFVGFVERRGRGWRWKIGYAHNPGPEGEGEPTRRRALGALLAAFGRAVDEWAAP